MAKATKKKTESKRDIPLGVNGNLMDIIDASVKDAKNRLAKKKAKK